jgi:hypothetical protein
MSAISPGYKITGVFGVAYPGSGGYGAHLFGHKTGFHIGFIALVTASTGRHALFRLFNVLG